jgi:pyrimidine operon attenuation protein/uracil phosphoribosyltransferase
MKAPKLLLENKRIDLIIKRFAAQLFEQGCDPNTFAIVGLQPRGVQLARRVYYELKQLNDQFHLFGELDHTLYRDDIGRGEIHLPKPSNIPFSTEGKRILLIDDVLYTGRSVRSAIDGLMHYGRPAQVELMVLIDRRMERELPIMPQYWGLVVDSKSTGEYVKVEWSDQEQMVWLLDEKR